MATSPLETTEGVVSVTVKADGTAIDGENLLRVDIEFAVNRLSRARFAYADGDPGFSGFPLTDAKFAPGTKVEIAAGYGTDAPKTLFKGVVVAQRLAISGENDAELEVECLHEAVKMTLARSNTVTEKAKDSAVIAKLVQDAGLSATVDSTAPEFTRLVQFDATDWDFLLARAEANGLVVVPTNDGLTVTAPDATQSATLVVTYGTDLIRFDGQVDARPQRAQAQASTWDVDSQAVRSEIAAALGQSQAGPGNLAPGTLADAFGGEPALLQTAAVLGDSLSPWAKARQLRAALAANRASLTFPGSAKAVLGETIELANLGDRFSGTGYIGAVRQRIRAGSWTTTVETGIDPDTHAERHSIANPDAAGLVAPMQGLQIGKVQKLQEDPDNLYRIEVKLPLLGDDQPAVWARLAGFYASNQFGGFWLPEIDDEVVVGFLNDDPAQAVVLGSVYNPKLKPPYDMEDQNNTKAVVTREKMKVEFDEENKKITITTPADNRMIYDDSSKTITVQDETGNKIELSTSGVLIDSPKDITLKAQGNISMTATMNVDIKGLNVSASADTAFSATGNATAKLSGSASTTIEGGVVMIN
ncbi:MAG: Rhs element Vgr protein [Alphaproteobacteria bacterium]|nr:Rhs element Vgr protein [Alphaproteobacteria bacterium]MCB9931165.1 Rhs element Vgr protein [Alphaproteobacteria bacterium]